MLNIIQYLREYLRNERGLEVVEWVLIGAIIAAIALIVYPGTLQPAMQGAMNTITNALNNP